MREDFKSFKVSDRVEQAQMNAAALKAATSSKRQDWETPNSVLDVVRAFAPISLDPCTTKANPTGAAAFIFPPHDGLAFSWACGGLVFVNPPYGRALPPWTKKMAVEAAAGAEIIGLVPARVETCWFRENIVPAPALCFWGRRITFRGATSGALFPCCFPYWGPRQSRFREVFGNHGWLR